MSKGPLVVSWGDWRLDPPQAGAISAAAVELRNVGTVPWRDEIRLSYHWLDDRGNPIVWDGIRTRVPRVDPGERATVEARVRGPIPPGRYRLAFDLVAEHRAWFSEVGNETTGAALDVAPRSGEGRADLPPGVEPAPEWRVRVKAAHADGYAVVAGAVVWGGRRAPHELAPYAPGSGRAPGFSAPLICPSVLSGVELDRLPDVAGLPAYAAPTDEPWLYDGRIALHVEPR